MQNIYPVSPEKVPANLSKPNKKYQQQALLAMLGLSLFITLYFTLTSWFIWTAYRLFASPNPTTESIIVGFLASLLAIFTLKPLFKVRHSSPSHAVEISPQDEPELFAFIYRLADEAKAPRPHKVFLSAMVNAAVFYDVSIVNLFFPSKKNLEIGLGLVNVLTIGELKAVLAHEFGHFAQRSMAVGNWVYITQQIASHIIYERDALDRVLRFLSRIDIRIAWIGWLLSLIVWSIRSLLETVFCWLLIAQRALSREMEFQADLVAVSLTGSDALIHALHKARAADEAWERTINFANSELSKDRIVTDLFTIQTNTIEKIKTILNDPEYCAVQPIPSQNPQHHRLFKLAIAEPPQMWSTHPSNADREHNAKRIYISHPLDDRPAWILFSRGQKIRKQMTQHLIQSASPPQKAKSVNIKQSLEELDRQYDRVYLDPAYRGTYLGRSIVRYAATTKDLYESAREKIDLERALASLYPESLTDDLEKLVVLEHERASLRALLEGYAKATDGMIEHRGQTISRQNLPSVIAGVSVEIKAVRRRILAHDRLCRTTHRVIAVLMGCGWEKYLVGLLKILHYTGHTQANLQDAIGNLNHVYRVVTADKNVSERELERLLVACNEVYRILEGIDDERELVQIDTTLSEHFDNLTWSEIVGDLELLPPNHNNIGQWIGAIGSIVARIINIFSVVEVRVLEQLLLTEKKLVDAYSQSETLSQAPTPSTVPENYPTLLPGKERKRKARLSWWDRFQTADGRVAELSRLLIAGAIIASVPLAVAILDV